MLKEIYAKPILEGYEVSVADAKTDYEAYKLLASTGVAMTADQGQRYADLKAVFEPIV